MPETSEATVSAPGKRTWKFGHESVILIPFSWRQALFKVNNFQVESEYSSSWDFSDNPRIWWGRNGGEGTGWQLSYFQFDHNDVVSASSPDQVEMMFVRDSSGPDISDHFPSLSNKRTIITLNSCRYFRSGA